MAKKYSFKLFLKKRVIKRFFNIHSLFFQGKVEQFVLVNLGATVDFLNVDEYGNLLTDESQVPLLGDQDRLELFILDSHRPVNLTKNGSKL